MICADVQSNIMVQEVAVHATSSSWKTCGAALMLRECDSRAQRAFFCTFEFDSRGSKQFGPPLMESNWYTLVGRPIEILPADEVREMCEIVRKADTGVKKDGSRGYGLE